MRRLNREIPDRTKVFSHRVVDVAEVLESKRRSRVCGRIVDQMAGSETSVGANTREADEAVSRKNFTRSLGIVLKELGESRYWIEFVGERAWIPSKRLVALLNEAEQLTKIFHTMISRTKINDRRPARAK